MKRIIFHVDVNSAFLSWEACYRLHHLNGSLDLRTVPSVVGGDQSKRHGIILAKSIPARRYGIHTGESIMEAKKKCPSLLVVPPNYTLYSKASRALISFLRHYTDRIEQYSIDEAFMDMTGIPCDPVKTAYEIKDTISRQLGFTVNIGVSENKLLAKMASDFLKPDHVHTLWPDEICGKMWPLPVSSLFYVGRGSFPKLTQLGIRTIGDLACFSPEILYLRMKSHGLLIREFANGIDESPVITMSPASKGYGNSTTTPHDVTDRTEAGWYLLSLAETVSQRIRADRVRITVVDISLRDSDHRFYHHQISLSVPTDLTLEIYDAACRCFDELWKGFPIRHLGIHTGKVSSAAGRQTGLFDKYDYGKLKLAEHTVDDLRIKYGNDCIKRARFIEPAGQKAGSGIDHMSGGISRERRNVDYTREQIL